MKLGNIAKKSSSLQPILPLVPIKLDDDEKKEKSNYISIELKTRVGQPANGTTYKKHIRLFNEGDAQEWIDVVIAVNEVWTQNSIIGGADRAATFRAVLRGESLVAFDAALDDCRRDDDGMLQQISPEIVEATLKLVAQDVFPHRALEIQRKWMERGLKKPFELTTRKTLAAISRMNVALPHFPDGTMESKFSDAEIVSILEWALPDAWRAKFDLDGYIPTKHNKVKLLLECEAIERSQELRKMASQNDIVVGSEKPIANKRGKKGKKASTASFFCTEHGKNLTHNSDACYVLKKKAGQAIKQGNKPPTNNLSVRSFRKEVNALEPTDKRKILDAYAGFILEENAKLKKSNKKVRHIEPIDSDSESIASVNLVDHATDRLENELSQEERAFLAQVHQTVSQENDN